MNDLGKHIDRRLLADGAMGTELIALGLVSECPETWNIEQPDAITGIHRRYVDAGAKLLLTNTFGANEWKLARTGRVGDLDRFCRAGVENALAAAVGRAWVLGDVGPTGELPAPFGTHDITEFEKVFTRQVASLAEAGANGILIESMSNGDEAAAAVRAAKRTCPLPVFATMTFAAGKNGYRTLMGETVAATVEKLLDAGADVVGSNCGLGADQMVDVIREIRAAAAVPILAKPNAGRARLEAGRTVFAEDAETWAAFAPKMAEAGATMIGGCCGTGPEHIARAATLLGSAFKNSCTTR